MVGLVAIRRYLQKHEFAKYNCGKSAKEWSELLGGALFFNLVDN
jgi:hypothetical protein